MLNKNRNVYAVYKIKSFQLNMFLTIRKCEKAEKKMKYTFIYSVIIHFILFHIIILLLFIALLFKTNNYFKKTHML